MAFSPTANLSTISLANSNCCEKLLLADPEASKTITMSFWQDDSKLGYLSKGKESNEPGASARRSSSENEGHLLLV